MESEGGNDGTPYGFDPTFMVVSDLYNGLSLSNTRSLSHTLSFSFFTSPYGFDPTFMVVSDLLPLVVSDGCQRPVQR